VHHLPAGAAAILAALAAGFWYQPDAFTIPAGAVDRLGGALTTPGAVLPQPAAARAVPAELAAAIARAQLQGTVASWCPGRFRPGGRAEYAVALAREPGGRYIVVDGDGMAVTLAAYSGRADLSCYSPAGARRLNRTLASSETISGRVSPRWNTTVVCGFVENTSAVCWQYSPTRGEFVKIGDLTT